MQIQELSNSKIAQTKMPSIWSSLKRPYSQFFHVQISSNRPEEIKKKDNQKKDNQNRRSNIQFNGYMVHVRDNAKDIDKTYSYNALLQTCISC